MINKNSRIFVSILSASSTPIIEVFDSAGSVTGQIGYNSTADKIYMSGSATPINFVTTSAETPASATPADVPSERSKVMGYPRTSGRTLCIQPGGVAVTLLGEFIDDHRDGYVDFRTSDRY